MDLPRVVVVVRPRAAAEPAPATVEAEPAAAPAPEPAVSPTPAPDYLPAEPWTPPVRFADRFSTWSVRGIRALLLIGALLLLTTAALWAIPTWRAAQRPGFQAVRQRALSDPELGWLVFEPRRVDRLPRWFGVGPEGERYELVVRGPAGQSAVVRAIVRDGKITRFSAAPEFDWHEAWQGRSFRR